MSGFGNFAPIHNSGINNAGIPQPGNVQNAQNAQNAQNVQNGNAQGNPPREAPAVNDDATQAQALIRSLDILLTRAGKAAGQAVDDAALAKVVKGAKFNKATVNSLRATAKAANDAMRVLDSFTGGEFADAMTIDHKTGVVEWDKNSTVAKAVQNALEKQQALSDALTKLLNDLPESATAEQQAALEEAMLQSDRRLSEIETVVIELTELAEKGQHGIDDKTQKRLDRRVVDLAGEKALEMHDRSQAIAHFQKELAPILAQLDRFDANPGQPPTKAQMTTFRRLIGEAKNAIAAAAKSGVVQIPKAGGGTREFFVDRTFLDEAAKLLGEAEAKLNKLRESATRDLCRKFVENEITFPNVDLLQPKMAAKLRALGTTDEERRQIGTLADLIEGLDKLRKALFAYAEKPSGSNKSRITDALRDLRDVDSENDWRAGLNLMLSVNVPADAANDPELRSALGKFRGNFNYDKAMKSLQLKIGNLVWSSDVIAAHIEALNNRARSSADLQGSDAVRSVFFGTGSFSTLVESRVHGYADGDIDPALDDRNVVSSRKLGQGGFNTVDLVTFKDGTKRVFKPEFDGRLAAENSPILTGLEFKLGIKQEMTSINLAVNKTADALGLGDVMVKTTAGVHNGVFGMYMEAAPGVEGRRLARGVSPRFDSQGNKIALGDDDIRNLPPDQRRIVNGRLMRQFNRLHWFDAITGQGDRHNANYMVEVRPDLTVTVKGIDNDASFSPTKTGLTKFLMPPTMAGLYMERVRNLSIAYGTGSKLAVDAVTSDPGFRKLRDGSIEIDVSKAKSPLVISGLYETTAFHQAAIPDEMDFDLCQQLKGLKTGPERDALLKDWATRFGSRSQQYQNAVARLNEAIARAEQLENEGKVYRAEDWESDAVQNRILNAGFPQDPMMKFSGREPGRAEGRTLVADYKYMMAGNLYTRDLENL